MKAIVPGYTYALRNLHPTEGGPRTTEISFVRKEADQDGNLVTVADGTTNEEVIQMVIDRLKFLDGKLSCPQNELAIDRLEEALMWLECRTSDRISRGVEDSFLD